MAKLTSDVIAAFESGLHSDDAAPAIFSSTLWEAWAVGRFLQDNEAEDGTVLHAYRGSTYTVDSPGALVRYRVEYPGDGAYRIEAV